MNDFFEQVPKIIEASAKKPLSVIALMIIAISFLGYMFFTGDDVPVAVRIWMFVLMFAGFGLLTMSLLRSAEPIRAAEQPVAQPPIVQRSVETADSVTEEELVSSRQRPPKKEPAEAIGTSEPTRLRETSGTEASSSLRKLATLWFVWSGLLFLLLVAQTLFGKYGDQPEWAWALFLPSLMPTMTAIVTILATQATSARSAILNATVYKLSIAMSICYLSVLTLGLLLEPLLDADSIEVMKSTSFYLTPFQSLVLASLIFMILSRRVTNVTEDVP
jgi:hypothetical protein